MRLMPRLGEEGLVWEWAKSTSSAQNKARENQPPQRWTFSKVLCEEKRKRG